MSFCPTCGKPVSETDRFCGNCGSAVTRPDANHTHKDEIGPTDVRFFCPHCGTELMGDTREAGATYPCLKCGKDVQVPAKATEVAQTTPAPTTPPVPGEFAGRRGRCKHCGHAVPVGTTPCPHCGHELKWGAPKHVPTGAASIPSLAALQRDANLASERVAISLGIFAILFCWIPIVGGSLAVIGLIVSGSKKSMAGIAFSVIALISAVVFAIHGYEAEQERERTQRVDQFFQELDRVFR